MDVVGHYLDGRRVGGRSGRTAPVYDPNNGSVAREVALASVEEVRAATASAAAAQPGWAAEKPQRRSRVLRRFLDLVEAEADQLAGLLASEHGKSRTPEGTSSGGSRWWNSRSASPACSRASTARAPAPGSTSTRCASRWGWWPASPRSISRP